MLSNEAARELLLFHLAAAERIVRRLQQAGDPAYSLALQRAVEDAKFQLRQSAPTPQLAASDYETGLG
jgi:hypothetical protein